MDRQYRRYYRIVTNATDASFLLSSGIRTPRQFAVGAGADAAPHPSSLRDGERVPIQYDNEYPSNDTSHSPDDNINNALMPPVLPRVRPIALPRLSLDAPIYTNAIITYSLVATPIIWDIALPPSSARLVDGRRIFHDVAVVPMITSFTIRIADVSCPIVVFPNEAGGAIRIIDVLRAVYNGMRADVFENGASIPAYQTSNNSRLAFADAAAAEAQVIRAHFYNRTWWNGLSESVDELDVWCLHLSGGPARGSLYL